MESSVHSKEHQQNMDKVEKLVKKIGTAMFTSINKDTNMLVSRPMQLSYFDKEQHVIWFFTSKTSAKARQLLSGECDPRVSVSFSDPNNQHFVSLSGRAEVVENRDLIKKWWNPTHRPFFEKGVNDPDLVLVQVHCQEVQFWDTKENKLETLWHTVTSAMTGKSHIARHEQAAIHLESE